MQKNNRDKAPNSENPEWTKEDFKTAKRFHELPQDLQRVLSNVTRVRGPQKEPTKQLVSIRMSADVLAALRATGKGWQSRADDMLRASVNKKASAR